MDIPSSRFQKLLTAAIAEARAEKLSALAMTLGMDDAKFEAVKLQAGVLRGYDDALRFMEEIEQKINAEAKG